MAGCLVGYVCMILPTIAFFLLGVWMGVLAAFMLNYLILHKFEFEDHSILLWIFISN